MVCRNLQIFLFIIIVTCMKERCSRSNNSRKTDGYHNSIQECQEQESESEYDFITIT